MRFKIGNTWHKQELGQPIMVELTDADKANIANMCPSCTRYAVIDDEEFDSEEAEEQWMDEGAQNARA